MERSHDHEVVWAMIGARPYEFLDDPRFYPVFMKNSQTNFTFQETQTAYLYCSIHQLEDKVKYNCVVKKSRRKASVQSAAVEKLTLTNYSDFIISGDGKLNPHGYSSRIDVCAVIGDKTGKFIDVEVMSSYFVEAYISEGPMLYIKSGNPVNLTCHVKDQVGTVFLFWYYNGRVLDADEKKRRDIDVFTDFRPITISRLFFAKAKLSDSGKYSCHPSYAKPANITLQVLNGE
ncbi:uncharacterized protein TNCT_351191 [Trichonephila clavata]|uniref:Ig-like domain-containing protein n=1 Tax=Trichonephila clavata TaxID=2740835 RepID=A0A8X6LBJ5_TRICU|nr:uncharacterized protein TNCT_351191 [Trichonephila clavata]